ncbi:MAG TPA: hypothetical protein VGC88_01415 [Terriglobales bacterium]
MRLGTFILIGALTGSASAQATGASSAPPGTHTAVPLPNAPKPAKEHKPSKYSCRTLWVDTPAEAPLPALTPRQKAKLAACDFAHPFTYIYAIGDASVSTAINANSPYGPGVQGAAKRFGVDMTDELADDFFAVYFFPTVFKQDPHFHPLGPGHPTHARVRYAMTRVFLAKRDDGKGNTINAGEIFGTITVSTLANTYHPGISQGLGNTAGRIGISIASDSGYNIWKEYEPQITRKLKLRLNIVRRLAEKITFTR